MIKKLYDKKAISPPQWLPNNVMYECMMGSVAYGVSNDTSDVDIYGFCIPPLDMMFPHLRGEIQGFGTQVKRFEQYQQHHVEFGRKEYDLSIYSIVKYFQLCMQCNPNMIDSLFTPADCVLHLTEVGNMVREQRHIFLHKGAWHKFKGYAYSQLNKMANREEAVRNVRALESELGVANDTTIDDVLIGMAQHKSNSPGPLAHLKLTDLWRLQNVYDSLSEREMNSKIHGFDTKFAYHVMRLLDEVEQILTTSDVDLRRDKERLKAVRRGVWSEDEIRNHFALKEKQLEKMYGSSTLPHRPNEAAIKQLLIDCIEHHYGSISHAVVNPGKADVALAQIKAILDGYETHH